MRWVAGILAIAALVMAGSVVFGVAVSVQSGSSSSQLDRDLTASPTPHSPTPTHYTIAPTNSPTPTPPFGCGGGEWEQCEKQAQSAPNQDFIARYHPAPNGTAVWSEYVEWPDSCLGVPTSGVACAQVITPGFRVYLEGADLQGGRTPYVEYHTDLNGHAVYAGESASPPPTSVR